MRPRRSDDGEHVAFLCPVAAGGYCCDPMHGAGRPTSALWAAILVVVAGLLGCGSSPTYVRYQIDFQLTRRANQNSPVAVALVVAKDQKFFENVAGKLTAKQWFEQREQLHRDDPSGHHFTEWKWEYVPGNPPPSQVISIESDAVAAVIFANYRAPGEHRVRVPPARRLLIDLGDEDVMVRPLEDQER